MSNALDHAATPEAFCAALKRAREQRGISLKSISDSTKIAESHLAALERGNLRHWPKGIYRRAYFHDYVRVVGLDPDTFDAFRRFFPDEDAPREGGEVRGGELPEVPQPRADLRLVLATDRAIGLSGWRRVAVALIDRVMGAALAMKVRLGAPRTFPDARSADLTEEAPQPESIGWVTDARRLPNAHPQMRVRMRVVR